MVRVMQDSTDGWNFSNTVSVPGIGVLPVTLWAGYQGGSYSKSSHNTGKVNVEIDVDGTHPSADVLDIEVGDATPNTAPGWVVAHNKVSNYPAILYCNRSTIHAVANALAAANLVVNKDYKWWIATLDGTKAVSDMTGVVAVQVWGANYFPGQNIDLSIVYDDAWKKATPPPVGDKVPGQYKSIVSVQRTTANDGWIVVGIGLDGNLWETQSNDSAGTWTTPSKLATVTYG